jgi:hypothetical protein
MNRLHAFELADQSWWPRTFRRAATDYLVTVIHRAKVYDSLVPRLFKALQSCRTNQIIDLCSGVGGPWPTLLPALHRLGIDANVCMTDFFPNIPSLERAAGMTFGLRYEKASVSATSVPTHLTGFRTIFTAFHHFRPNDAREILASAVRDRVGILIAEATPRRLTALAIQIMVPLAVLLLTPTVRPFRWSRLFWTYFVPVLPLAIFFDGVVSCLRTYTPEEMLAMAREIDSVDYEWQAGYEAVAGVPVPIPYMIGTPKNR